MYQYLLMLWISVSLIEPSPLLLKEINIIRTHGYACGEQILPTVDTLSWSPELALIAEEHAQDMQDNNYFSHYNHLNQDVGIRADSVHYGWNQIGENIAIGFLSNFNVMSAWLESEEHCEMIMYEHISEMGAARVGKYWVVNFGKPDLVMSRNHKQEK